MSNEITTNVNPLTVIVLLGAVLGPLAALSIGSKTADEETLARANAGLANAKPTDLYANYDATRSAETASARTVAEIAQGSGVFRDLQAIIESADVTEMLGGEARYTVFAPSSEAFSKLTPEQRSALLNDKEASSRFIASHVVPGRLTETILMQMQAVSTLSGKNVPVSSLGEIKVGDATVSKSIGAENGMVHVIDRVML